MRRFINDQICTKSIVIENTDKEVSINLIYGDIIKITPWKLFEDQHTELFDKLQERYALWGIDNCTCKPKKIRVLADDFEKLKYSIGELESISNINDVKLGINIYSKYYKRLFFKYDTIVFNNSTRLMSDKETKFIFTGDALAAVCDGNYYSFRLDQRTKESENSIIEGKYNRK